MPGMQRLITLDSVIYVHENPRRSRQDRHVPSDDSLVAPELLAASAAEAGEPESGLSGSGSYAEPSEAWSPAVTEFPAAAAEPEALRTEPEPEAPALAAAAEPWGAESGSDRSPGPDSDTGPVASFGERTRTIVRSAPAAPPPGYAVEFGTGRLVPLHSFRGRMSYPTGGR